MSRDGKPGILNLRSEAYEGRQEGLALHDVRQCVILINHHTELAAAEVSCQSHEGNKCSFVRLYA